jgi:hypothetical protein
LRKTICHRVLGPITVFWVVGNASVNSVLITDYLPTNQHNGDRLRRVFPLSPFDYSIELTINHDTHERAYSCVIDGATDVETTLFTYIVRSIGKLIYCFFCLSILSFFSQNINIDLQGISDKTKKAHKNETIIITNESETEKSSIKTENILAHDSLTSQQIDELRQKNLHEHSKWTDFCFI